MYRGHQCAYQDGATNVGPQSGYIRNDTGWLTNCLEIGKAQSKRSPGDHSRLSLEGGLPTISAFYSRGICRAVVKGLVKAAKQNDEAVTTILNSFWKGLN